MMETILEVFLDY